LIGTSGIQKLCSSEIGPWVGIMIGSRESRSLGLGTAFLWIVTYLVFSNFNVNTIFAGMKISNIASYRTFHKIGYQENIAFTEEYKSKNLYSNKIIIVSCSKSDFVEQKRIGITSVNELPDS